MIKKLSVAVILFGSLCTIFQYQEGTARIKEIYLPYAPPANLQKVVLGYLTPLGAELQYSTLMVYVGTILDRFGTKKLDSEQNSLGYNFENIVKMYPQFIDTFFFCQAILPYSSKESAITASEIHLLGEKTHKDSILLPFFAGFNYFYFAEMNEKAAEILFRVSQKDGAPGWLGHLAAVLRAEEGNIEAGLFSLKVLLNTTSDESEKKRLTDDIDVFERALEVEQAIKRYESSEGKPLDQLVDLVPNYLTSLPDMGNMFELFWDGRKLQMVRPEKKNNKGESFTPFIN